MRLGEHGSNQVIASECKVDGLTAAAVADDRATV